MRAAASTQTLGHLMNIVKQIFVGGRLANQLIRADLFSRLASEANADSRNSNLCHLRLLSIASEEVI